jgi:hypothetical protein
MICKQRIDQDLVWWELANVDSQGGRKDVTVEIMPGTVLASVSVWLMSVGC